MRYCDALQLARIAPPGAYDTLRKRKPSHGSTPHQMERPAMALSNQNQQGIGQFID
jgi:hypothetical protein